MPPPASRLASTLARTGPPAARAAAASRATSPGLAAGSRPTLLSPHTTRSGRAPGGRAWLSRSLARNRSSTGPTTPGWTNATRAVPAGDGAPLPAPSRKLTPHPPPRAATDSSAGAFHWLAPSSPQGPPSPSQERSASPTTNALGTTTRTAASRPGVGAVDNGVGAVDNSAPASRGWATLPVGAPGTGGSGSAAPPSRAQANQPTGSQVAARSMARGTMNGPTVGTRKALTARKNPVPPSQARTAASRPVGAAMARASTGASP